MSNTWQSNLSPPPLTPESITIRITLQHQKVPESDFLLLQQGVPIEVSPSGVDSGQVTKEVAMQSF